MYIMIFITLLLLVMLIAIPVFIGVYVYKDASKREMNPILWTLLSVLAPGFIGLIIYLIIRNNHSDMRCPKCGQHIKDDFVICPSCGETLKERCENCGCALKSGWLLCPECGKQIPEETISRIAPPKKDKGLKWILWLVVSVPFVLCIFIIIGFISFSASYEGASDTELLELTVEDIDAYDPDISDWLDECDRSGEGAYMLSYMQNNGENVSQEYLLYRNDGGYDMELSFDMGGFLKKPQIIFYCIDNGEKDYSLYWYHYSGSKNAECSVKEDNRSVAFTETSYNDEIFSPNVFTASARVFVDESVNTVYAISFDVYDENGEIIFSDSCTNANGSPISSEESIFSYDYTNSNAVSAVEISVYDADDHELEISNNQKFAVEKGGSKFDFKITYDDKTGKLTISE